MKKSSTLSLLMLAGLAVSACTPPQDEQTDSTGDTGLLPYQERPITDDVIYFLLPDRFHNGDPNNDTGGIEGGISDHGFDPTHKGFYHGGDLNGVTEKLVIFSHLARRPFGQPPSIKTKLSRVMESGCHPGIMAIGLLISWLSTPILAAMTHSRNW